MSKGVQIAVGAVAVLALLGFYGWSEIEDGSFVYYKTLEEFRAAGETGRASRVHGYVALGTIERDVATKTVRFQVQSEPPHAGGSAAGALPVVYASLETPDLFKDGAEVVVEGRMARSGSFEATNLLAKCPSKFEGMAEGAEPGEMAEGATPPGASS